MIRKFLIITSLIIVICSSFIPHSLALTSSEQDAIMTGDVAQSRAGISTYITGAWNVSYSTLRALVGGDTYMNYDNFCRVIEEYFIPFNQRLVGLFVGWDQHANTSVSDIPYYEWVDDWLSACDKYGIGNLFYLGEWGISSSAPSWWDDVLKAHPDLQSYDKNGLPATLGKVNPISIDHPQVIEQYKEDLKQLWEYYGRHPSWIGWGSFSGDYAHYAGTDAEIRDVGFANYSVYNFAKTIYYLRDVNETGFHEDGTKCKIWERFVEYNPLTVFDPEVDVQRTSDRDVYGGTETSGRIVAMKFKVPENLTEFHIKWHGTKMGEPPGPLTLELYIDEGDAPSNLGIPIESVVQASSEISTNAGWQPIVPFKSKLEKDKHYWIVFQTSGGDSSNKYHVHHRSWKTDDSTCKVSHDGYFPERWIFSGSAILWIQDVHGVDRKIYPWRGRGKYVNTANLDQSFTPTEDITINTVFLHVADRQFNETGSTVQIIRVADDEALASGLLHQKLISGLWCWVPIILNKRITLKAGVEYAVRLVGLKTYLRHESGLWEWAFQTTDPASVGLRGENRTKLFKLADMDLSALQNYMRCNQHVSTGGETGEPGITDIDWYATRFKPTINASLSTVDVKMAGKYGAPADFKIALRADYDGIGERPADIDLESKTVPAEDITTGWTSTTGWTKPLTANNWYWIVFSMAAPAAGGYRIFRTVNPIEYKPRRTTDGGKTWEIPREVVELVFAAATTAEVFKVEPGHAEFGTDATKITDKYLTAQSFSPNSSIVVKGVLLFLVRGASDPGRDLIVELRADSGADTPSMQALTPGVFPLTSMVFKGLQYIDLKFPVALAANQKYWIVLRSAEDTKVYCPNYIFREPKDSFGGTEYKAKRSNDGGFSWYMSDGKEADIIFGIVQPVDTTPYEFCSTTDLSDDILNYHIHKMTDEPLHGWNVYLNLQTSKILRETAEWFEEYSGRRWYVTDVNPPRITKEVGGLKYLLSLAFGTKGSIELPPPNDLFFDDSIKKLNDLMRSSCTSVYPWSSWGHWGSSTGRITPEQIGLYFRMTLPLLARAANVFDWDATRLVDANQQAWNRAYGEILSRMRYYGGYYGSEKGAVNALFIGDMDTGMTLQFFTPALNITLCGFGGLEQDYNLTKFGDFGQFDAIVWWADGPGMQEVTPNVQERVKAFVQNGGGLVVTEGWPDWANEILGFDHTGERMTPGDVNSVDYSHPILKPYTDITGYSYYWRDRRITPLESDPGTYIVKDINGLPWISDHAYGNGRGIFCGTPCENWSQLGDGIHGSPRESYLVLLNNAIFYAAKKERMLPVWWFKDYENQFLPWHTQLWYSVCGKPGRPVLLWLTNNENSTSFEIHLNAKFFNIDPDGWIAIDVRDWTMIAEGTGTDIKIDVAIPAKTWRPIYICNQTTHLRDIYSNIFILKRSVYLRPVESQAVYTLRGPHKQTGWLILNSSQPIAEVRSNESNVLPSYPSLSNLNASGVSTGWFHDPANNLLYIKVTPTSPIQIRIIERAPSPPIYERYPYLIPIVAAGIVTIIEVAVRAKRRRGTK